MTRLFGSFTVARNSLRMINRIRRKEKQTVNDENRTVFNNHSPVIAHQEQRLKEFHIIGGRHNVPYGIDKLRGTLQVKNKSTEHNRRQKRYQKGDLTGNELIFQQR